MACLAASPVAHQPLAVQGRALEGAELQDSPEEEGSPGLQDPTLLVRSEGLKGTSLEIWKSCLLEVWPVENEIRTQGNQPVAPAGTLGTAGASPSAPPSFGARSQGQPDVIK